MAALRSRNWCFTINNPTEEDSAEELKQQASYVIIGKEVGEGGTPHLQGYCHFKTMKSLSQLKKLLPRAHLEVCKGSPEDNIAYCQKDGDYIEFGEAPMSKKRKGEKGAEFWAEQLSLAKRGRIDDMDPKVQLTHFSTIQKIVSKYAPMPDDADGLTGEWFWGESGTGKSRKARDDNPGFYLKLCNKWWDGYNGEECAILEDFDKDHHMLAYHLKIWADRYAFPAEVKGGKINIRPKKIIVTSNYHPQDIWSNNPQSLDPILRRFKITHFNKSL